MNKLRVAAASRRVWRNTCWLHMNVTRVLREEPSQGWWPTASIRAAPAWAAAVAAVTRAKGPTRYVSTHSVEYSFWASNDHNSSTCTFLRKLYKENGYAIYQQQVIFITIICAVYANTEGRLLTEHLTSLMVQKCLLQKSYCKLLGTL